MIVKLILICAVVGLFVAFLRSKPGVRIQAGKRVAVIVFAAVNIYAIVRRRTSAPWPTRSGSAAGRILVLYALVIAFLMGMLNFYIRFKGADQRFTQLARAMALREAEVTNPERLGADGLGVSASAARWGDAERD